MSKLAGWKFYVCNAYAKNNLSVNLISVSKMGNKTLDIATANIQNKVSKIRSDFHTDFAVCFCTLAWYLLRKD